MTKAEMLFRMWLVGLHERLRAERGIAADVVVWIALGVGVAVAAGTYIVAKILNKAHSINFG